MGLFSQTLQYVRVKLDKVNEEKLIGDDINKVRETISILADHLKEAVILQNLIAELIPILTAYVVNVQNCKEGLKAYNIKGAIAIAKNQLQAAMKLHDKLEEKLREAKKWTNKLM